MSETPKEPTNQSYNYPTYQNHHPTYFPASFAYTPSPLWSPVAFPSANYKSEHLLTKITSEACTERKKILLTRHRTSFAPNQREVLEDYFKKSRYPSAEQREQIAEIIGVEEVKVKNWFKNKRAKLRQMSSRNVETNTSQKRHHEETDESAKALREECSLDSDKSFPRASPDSGLSTSSVSPVHFPETATAMTTAPTAFSFPFPTYPLADNVVPNYGQNYFYNYFSQSTADCNQSTANYLTSIKQDHKFSS